MINKENIPKGTQIDFTEKINLKDLYGIEAAYGHSLFWLYAAPNTEIANFIAEAFNVFNKTGMTPEELANFHKGYKSHLSKHGSPQTYYVAKCSELEKQIEQLQQENDEQRRLLKKIEDGIASSIKNDIPVSVFMQQQLKNIQSLTTQQEEKNN